jgi:hypothetical protein
MIASKDHLPLSGRYVLQHLFLALAVLVGTGCSTTGPMTPERSASIKRIGVVSLLPSELSYEKIGITVFNNEYAKREVGNDFNSAARRSAENALKKLGREVIQVDIDVPRLAKKLRSGVMYFDSSAEFIKEDLLAAVREHRLDALVVIAQAFDSDNGVRGIRMYFRAGFNEVAAAVLMPDIGIVSVDEKIKRLAYGCCESRPLAVERPDGGRWRYKLEENIDATTHAYLSEMIQRNIADTVTVNIRAMGF